MTESEKFIIKFSILQTLLQKSAGEVADMVGYSRQHTYKVLRLERTASTGMVDSLNALILFVFGSAMLGLINSTIELLENTTVGTLLKEGFANEQK
ncbi:hypothetical protein H6A19_05910 [Clostridium saudiense]|uniref:XRE family transcriptional regulator n=1 Tax=Clostridium saudiense TaxID=1414720 RepID=A0ABS2FEH4_9CLOT|nr:hypothetical protein [Clostridium saudiense]MBM6818873.1 hypothetical protein [Clostridium saudiense]